MNELILLSENHTPEFVDNEINDGSDTNDHFPRF